MCSVWVHGPGACVSFAVAKFLVLATEELDCSRRGLLLPTSPDRARRTFCFVLRGSGQQTKSSCTQTQSLCSVHSRPRSSSIGRPLESSYASKSACFGLSFAIMLEVLRGNHNTRHLRRSPQPPHLTAWPAKSLSRGRSAVPFLTVGLPRPAGGNFVARRSRSPCLPRRPQLRRSCS